MFSRKILVKNIFYGLYIKGKFWYSKIAFHKTFFSTCHKNFFGGKTLCADIEYSDAQQGIFSTLLKL
jgi:hypothetical protein